MPTPVTFNGTNYSVPLKGERGWATSLSAYLVAIANGCLQKSGGAFTLLNEVDFGSVAGIKSLHLSSRSTNVSSTGLVRLANTDTIAWRRADNGADLALSVSAGNQLQFNGVPLVSIANGAANRVLRMNSGGTSYSFDTIIDACIDASAFISLSKLATVTASRALESSAGGIIQASSVTSVELGRLSGVTSAIQGQIDGKQAINTLLTAISGLAVNGIIVRTASNTSAARTLTAGSTKISISNGDGVSGNPTFDVVEANVLINNLNGTLGTSKGGTGVSGTAVFPTTGTVVTRDATETLTNKTLTAPVINSPTGITKADVGLSNVDNTSDTTKNAAVATLTNKTISGQLISDFADIAEVAGPATPSAGRVRVYAKNTKKLYTKDSNGVETEVGASGASGINYISNFDFEQGAVTGWAVYADTAAATPVDGISGAANVTFTATTTTPLRGTYSGLFTKDAVNRQGQGASFDFSINRADRSKPLQLQFDFENVSGTYAAGDLRVFIYDVTNATLITPSSVNVPGGSGTFTAMFVSTTSTSYRLIIHVATTSAFAYALEVDNVRVGPFETLLGMAGSDWQSYTPTTQGFGTITSVDSYWRRIGDTVHIRGSFISGAPGAPPTAVEARIGLPPGLIQAASESSSKVQGRVYRNVGTAGSRKQYTAVQTANQNYMRIGSDDSASASFPSDALNGNAVAQASESVQFDFQAVIQGWTSNVQMADRAVEEYASNSNTADMDDTTSFAYGSNGSPIPTIALNTSGTRAKNVRFQTPILPTDSLIFEIQHNSGNTWLSQRVSANASTTAIYGVFLTHISPTDVTVNFGRAGASMFGIGSLNATGETWSNFSRWRVRKVSGGAAVGFPIDRTNLVYPGVGNGSFYEEGTFATTSAGFTAALNPTVKYTRIGKTVTLTFPSISGTSNSTSFTLSGMPSSLSPAQQMTLITRVVDGGVGLSGYIFIAAAGTVINFLSNPGGSGFTASGSKGSAEFSWTYSIA